MLTSTKLLNWGWQEKKFPFFFFFLVIYLRARIEITDRGVFFFFICFNRAPSVGW